MTKKQGSDPLVVMGEEMKITFGPVHMSEPAK